jgi:hypothetical protein
MRHSFRIEPLAALLAGLIVAAALPAAAAEPKGQGGQIYQQRAADGRIVLTDRPSSTAVTERTWQVDREDKAAAQQRAQDLRKEADAVSERVQRRIEAQERIAAAEQDRAFQAQQRDQQMARYDDALYYPGYASGFYPNGRFWYEKPPPFFEIGTHRNTLGKPSPKRPTHHSSRSSGGFKGPARP